ncbi:MAG: serine/threonine-protein kinase [Planctomycetota bacterium]
MHPRYEFLEVLGQGGCGVVRRALDRATNTQVAIKSLLPPYDAGAATRFEREAQALAALRHPHVIPVLDVLPGPPPSFVMPLVDGGSLQDRLKSGPLELQEVLSLGQTLGETLHVVHAHGLVHRDLKPANVLVHHGQPLLADFGLARGPRGHTITATGEVLGTPGYLAPEQALSLPIGPWTDVYGLGALLYALLTGEPPFKGQSALHAMQAVVQEPAPSVRAARPDVPEWVDAVLQRCMAKEPQQRFATALELTDALLPPGAARRGPPRAALALGAVVALLVGGAVWALVPRGAQGPTPPPADPTPPARAPEPPPLPETDLVAPDVARLLATSDTTWLDALPPRGTVRGPGPWPPPEELERFALLLFGAGFDAAREAILTRYPASGLEGARDAAEVARTIGYVQLEQELLAPFAAREWEVAVRLAELDPTAPLPDPQGYAVAPHVAADDLALLGCMRLEGGDLGSTQRAHLEDLTRRLPSLPPRQLVAWAGTLSGFRFTPVELDDALTAIEARLRRPSGLSLPQRLELLRSYGQICVRLEARAGEPPATRALQCAQRVLAWSPANPAGLVLGLNALVELGRLPEALELGAWLLARKLPGRGGWFSAFLYCKALEQTLPPSLAPPPEHVLDALEQAYPAGQPLPKPLWTPLRPALDLAAAPHTHGRLRAFVRSLLPHAPGPALRAALVQWSARCTLHLEGGRPRWPSSSAPGPGTPGSSRWPRRTSRSRSSSATYLPRSGWSAPGACCAPSAATPACRRRRACGSWRGCISRRA